MVSPWNPNSPTLYGIEDPLARSGAVVIDSYSDAVVQQLVAQATETITQLALPDPFDGEFLGATVDLAVGIFTSRPDQQTGYTVGAFQPNAFTDRVGWTTEGALTTNLHLSIDEGTATPDESDYIRDTTTGLTHVVDFQFGTAAFPASKRILDVRVRARVKGGDIGFQVVHASGSSAVVKSGYSGNTWRTVEASFGEICPWTGKVWTSTDVALFDTATAEIRVSRQDTSTGTFRPQVAALQMGIEYCDENRVAVGHLATLPASAIGMAVMDLFTPAGVANWSKVAGTTYYIVLRRYRKETGVVPNLSSWNAYWTAPADEFATSVVWPFSYSNPTLASKGGRLTALNESTNQRFAFGALLATSFASVDSQPYARATFQYAAVYKMRQRFVSPASAAYGVVRLLLVSAQLPTFDPTLPTTIKVKRASDDVQMGSTITVTREDMTEDGTFLVSSAVGDVWQVQLDFAVDPVLVAGTAYFLEFTGSGPMPVFVDLPENGAYGSGVISPPTTPSTTPGDMFSSATFGSDATHVSLGVDDPTYSAAFGEHLGGDYVFILAQAPATLTGFTVTADEQLLDVPTPDLEQCPTIDAMPLVRLAWNQSALGADFVRYEVERYDQLTDTWARIANLTAVTATQWFDPDARFGLAESYRVRQVRSGEIASDWAGGVASSITLSAPECGLYLTVAEEQELNMAAMDVYGSGPAARDFDFLDRKVLVPMIGRDYQVAFQPTETRGVAFSRTVLVNAITTVVAPSIDHMEPLRLLARAPVSAVCVRDHEGNRWYMAIDVPSGSIRQDGGFVYVQLTFTQVGAVPVAYTGLGQQLGGS